MRFMPRFLARWLIERGALVRTLVIYVWVGAPLLIGYALLQRLFGPYRHWTLWVRGPIAAVVSALFLWAYAVGPLFRFIRGRDDD